MKQAYFLLLMCTLLISAQMQSATSIGLRSFFELQTLYSEMRESVVNAPFVVSRPALHEIAEGHFGKIAGSCLAGLVGACAIGSGLKSFFEPETLYSAVRKSVVNAPFIVHRPALHKIAEEHFGKIAGSLASACAVGYGIHKFIEQRTPAALYNKASESFITGFCESIFNRTPNPDLSVAVRAKPIGSTDSHLEIRASLTSNEQMELVVTELLSGNIERQQQYRITENLLADLLDEGHRAHRIDYLKIILCTIKNHRLAHPESTGGTISQLLPVFERNLRCLSLDPSNDLIVKPLNSSIAVMDQSNTFLWPDEGQVFDSKRFLTLFYWAALFCKFTNGRHPFLIEERRTDPPSVDSFQAAWVEKETIKSESGPIFSYQFTVNNQQKTFRVSGYQTELEFIGNWQHVWGIINEMSPQDSERGLITITRHE